ncbi:NAD-dependent epimerase/dehydratase, partial [mine drainage metagenome]
MDEGNKINTASVPYRFLRSALNSEPLTIYGDGTQSRDFIYIKDCVSGIIRAFENGRTGETYNIGTGTSTSYNDLAKTILKVTKSNSRIKYIENPLKYY